MNKELAKSYQEIDYQRERFPYKMYLLSLEQVFDFSIIESVLDLGCQNARLIELINQKYPEIKVMGVDYFEWAKKYANEKIRDYVKLMDLARPQNFGEQYDLVNSSEVGEHIEKESEGIFLDNLVNATRDTLILTWSNEVSHDHDQHQNPRPKQYIIEQLKRRGLVYWTDAEKLLADSLKNNLSGIGFNWWAKNIMVFKKTRFFKPESSYLIQNLSSDDANHRMFHLKRGLAPISFQSGFIQLTRHIKTLAVLKQASSILRASDGDYFFLRKIEIGSAKPGRRALTKEYDQINIPLFRSLFWHNDIISMSVEKWIYNSWKGYIFYDFFDKLLWKLNFKLKGQNTFKYINYVLDKCFALIIRRKFFLRIIIALFSINKGEEYRKKTLSILNKSFIPLECVYALVATKWIFKNFKNEIGIIAGGPKTQLIKLLMERDEYKKYVRMDYFTDYIEVPQIGAADDLLPLSQQIGERILNSKAKIFLVGVGSSKLGLMPLLKAYSNAIFIDVGCGIDAIAGVVCQERPFFGEWINYRIKGFDYNKVDFMDQGNPAWSKPEYKTQWID